MELIRDEYLIDKDLARVLPWALGHLLRNTLVHGLEDADERKAMGKPAVGRIAITLEPDGDRMTLVYADDGRGLDLERIAALGRARGLVTEQASPEAVANLIFVSQLSTRDTVDDLAGRGVGLDAVRKLVQEVEGDIQVVLHDEQNAGGCRHFHFVLKFPLRAFQPLGGRDIKRSA